MGRMLLDSKSIESGRGPPSVGRSTQASTLSTATEHLPKNGQHEGAKQEAHYFVRIKGSDVRTTRTTVAAYPGCWPRWNKEMTRVGRGAR